MANCVLSGYLFVMTTVSRGVVGHFGAATLRAALK